MKKCLYCFNDYFKNYTVCPHCGQIENNEPDEPVHLLPGTVLAGRYLIGHSVGSGGFGIVYKAKDLKLETVLAVKEFFVSRLVTRAQGLKNLIVTKKSQTEFAYRKERFLAEARTMAKMGSHRSIPNVFEFFEENNTAYIVMEYLDGLTLGEYLTDNKGKIDLDFAIMIASEVANALRSLHEHNIIHRDVAPDNIFICTGKTVKLKLMDLGAAKLADSTDEAIDIILKPGYSPPEQYDNSSHIGPWSDIYALGATLYAMVTGSKPIESTNRKISDELVAPNQINPLISDNLNNTIMKAMALERHMRFKNITEFLKAINGEKTVIPLAKEKKRRSRRRGLGIALSCLILLVGAVMGYGVYSQKKSDQYLEDATINVWISVADDSTEKEAMDYILADFMTTFPNVTVELEAFTEADYTTRLLEAAQNDALPHLFESSNLPDDVLDQAVSLDKIIRSEQFENCLFLDHYKHCYPEKKQMPLAIEVPVAFVITNGAESINYQSAYFTDLADFAYENIAVDERYTTMVQANFAIEPTFTGRDDFFDNTANRTAVLLSSTKAVNEVRQTLTNYEKAFVYPDLTRIICHFTYEWSISPARPAEQAAAEKLLTWMLGNVYQNALMISKNNDGEIPVNPASFTAKTGTKYYAAITQIYSKFVFERKDKN